jgi:hypothetical protein
MKSELEDFMEAQKLKDKIHNSIRIYEGLMRKPVPKSAKESVIKYMERKIDQYVKDDTLIPSLIAIATIALIKLKLRDKKK